PCGSHFGRGCRPSSAGILGKARAFQLDEGEKAGDPGRQPALATGGRLSRTQCRGGGADGGARQSVRGGGGDTREGGGQTLPVRAALCKGGKGGRPGRGRPNARFAPSLT